MKHRRIIRIINTVLIAVFIIAAANIIKIYYDYGKADDVYTEIQDSFVQKIEPEQSLPVKEEQPVLQQEPAITVDFETLISRNEDVIGWLYCPGTVINYPVVQGEDNDQYLRRDLDGKYLVTGTLFADYRNGELGTDPNYIIYGHNMKNDMMFGSLTKYKEQSYYDEHPVLYYLTPDKVYTVELYAGLVVKRDSQIYSIGSDRSLIAETIKRFKAESTFSSDVEYQQSDTVITLSTCSYEFDNARYVIVGRLTENITE